MGIRDLFEEGGFGVYQVGLKERYSFELPMV